MKNPLNTKNTHLTTDITLPSRYLIFIPKTSHIKISQHIKNESKHKHLKKIITKYYDEQNKFIIHTATKKINETKLTSDTAYLKHI